MDEKKRIDALETALNNEMREREFYIKHGEKTNNPVGKALFFRIAEDELEHYERLKRLHEQWKKEGKWPETLPLEVKKTNVKDVLLQTINSINVGDKTDEGALDAIKIAIDFEEKGISLYKELRDAVDDEKEKRFFELLVSIETEHYLSLKDAEEYLVDPSSWFIKTEHHTLDGG
ncbi:MAG: ferritin family protein [Syntrophorhabdaceae bacterium]|nr:ferritin family protein [Syntrophorhabdaceae bacterium]